MSVGWIEKEREERKGGGGGKRQDDSWEDCGLVTGEVVGGINDGLYVLIQAVGPIYIYIIIYINTTLEYVFWRIAIDSSRGPIHPHYHYSSPLCLSHTPLIN